LVLIDGYRRVAALRRLGRDRAFVERWPCDLAEALLGVLARARNRSFAAIEEALLLRELTEGLGVSQREIGRRCGHDDSWVNRRLQLLSALPESGLAAVCAGRLSTWVATRVIAPLARASSAHAEQLLAALTEAPLSTRELCRWFEHYQKARRAVRERMVKHPKLFVQALNESAAQDGTERLRVGPEGESGRPVAHQRIDLPRAQAAGKAHSIISRAGEGARAGAGKLRRPSRGHQAV
jgi:ParB family chromosome partitioning protein